VTLVTIPANWYDHPDQVLIDNTLHECAAQLWLLQRRLRYLTQISRPGNPEFIAISKEYLLAIWFVYADTVVLQAHSSIPF